MVDRYRDARSLEQALTSRARTDSARLGIPIADLLSRFYFQRLVARVFQEEGWMLKGGQALLVRYPESARSSRDIDIYHRGYDTQQDAVDALIEASQRDLDDYIEFRFIDRRQKPNAATARFDVRLAGRRKEVIDVDVVVHNLVTSAPTRTRLIPSVSIPWPDTWPEVLLYPLVDHISDKICAMYEPHEGGSTRARDLVDLLLISQKETIVGRDVQFAMKSEVQRRQGTALRLPSAFHVPSDRWPPLYAKAAAAAKGLRGCQTLDEATKAADVFLTPLLSGSDPGVWNPETATWEQ